MADDQDLELKRVRELEAMVQKLTVENKRLLTKVDTSTAKTGSRDDSDEEVSSLGSDTLDDAEDEWLYVSPVRPPTKEQKKLTPQQWLEGDRNGGGLSLSEAQRVLTFTLEEEEKFSDTNARIGKRLQTSNKTAQKYLHQVRQRRGSLSESEDSFSDRHSPLKEEETIISLRNTHNTNNNIVKPVIPRGTTTLNTKNGTVGVALSLKVKWTPRAYSDSEEEENMSGSTGGKNSPTTEEEPKPANLSLKVAWDPSRATVSSSEGENEEEAMWKVKQVPPNLSPEVPEVSSGEQRKQATVQRSGTFTKIDRKMVKPRVGESALRMKWTPKNVDKNVSASSPEEDVTQRTTEEQVNEDEPSFTSYPTLTRPVKKNVRPSIPPSMRSPDQTIPAQRGISPVHHGMSSPLQYNRKSSTEGIGRISRSPSPSSLVRTPPTSSLRPPSPRRISNESVAQNMQQQQPAAPRRQLPSPSRLKSPGQQITPPSSQGTRLQTPGQRTSSLQGRQTGGHGLRTPSSLTPPKVGGVRGQISPLSSPSGVRRQAVPIAKSTRGGGVRKNISVQPSPSATNPPVSQDGWLDGCY